MSFSPPMPARNTLPWNDLVKWKSSPSTHRRRCIPSRPGEERGSSSGEVHHLRVESIAIGKEDGIVAGAVLRITPRVGRRSWRPAPP